MSVVTDVCGAKKAVGQEPAAYLHTYEHCQGIVTKYTAQQAWMRAKVEDMRLGQPKFTSHLHMSATADGLPVRREVFHAESRPRTSPSSFSTCSVVL